MLFRSANYTINGEQDEEDEQMVSKAQQREEIDKRAREIQEARERSRPPAKIKNNLQLLGK